MPTKVSGSLGLQAGIVNNAADEKIVTAGASASIKAQGENGYYAQANGLYGTGYQIGVELCKATHLGISDFYVNAGAGAQYTKSNITKDYYRYIVEGNSPTGPTWKPEDKRAYGLATVSLKKDWGEVGLGAIAGYKQTKLPVPQQGELNPDIGALRGVEKAGNNKKGFVSPIFTGQFNLLEDKLALNLNASLEGGTLGLCWTF